MYVIMFSPDRSGTVAPLNATRMPKTTMAHNIYYPLDFISLCVVLLRVKSQHDLICIDRDSPSLGNFIPKATLSTPISYDTECLLK